MSGGGLFQRAAAGLRPRQRVAMAIFGKPRGYQAVATLA